MNENDRMNNNYDEYEIDLREYILLIWKKKFLLVGLVIVAMVSAVVFTNITADPRYEASSTLLIMPPMYTTSIEVGSLPIETYRELAITSQMRNKIIEELDLRDDEGELISPDALENRMEFEIAGREEMEREGEMVEVPLIKLNVNHRDPEISADIANLWADLFMEDTRAIRRAETSEISTVIENRFEDTRDHLNEAREELKDFMTETRLEKLKSSLKAEKDQFDLLLEEKSDLEYQISLLEAELEERENYLNQITRNDFWINELSINEDNQELIGSAKVYIDSRDKLLDHKNKFNIDLLENERDYLQNKIVEYKNKISELKIQLEVLEKQNEVYEEILVDESKKIQLDKSLSDLLVFQEIMNPEELEILGEILLIEEEMNPLYFDFKELQNQNLVSINEIKSELVETENSLQNKNNELDILLDTLNREKETRDRLEINKDNYADLFNQENEYNLTLVQEKREINIELNNKKARLSAIKEQENRISESVAELDNQIREYEIVEDDLQQQIDDYQKSYEQLASRVEEARLAQAEQTSDVKFIADAVPPERATIGVGNTMLNMAVAAVLAGMLGVFGIFFAEFIKEE